VQRDIGRRDALKGIGAAAIAGLAGCTDSGGNGNGGGNGDGSGGDTGGDGDGTETPSDGGSSGTTDSFEYTFESDDDVAESSLAGVRVNYPDGSGAVGDASVSAATLGGEDITGDLDGTSTSNNGSSLRADFGGNYDIAAGDALSMELSGVDAPDGSYTVEVVVNPQSGATAFETSF
jgi:hypothetical protein